MRGRLVCVLVLVGAWTLGLASRGYADCSLGCYGPGLAADSLGNTVVGGPYSNVVSYRFRAGHSGALQKILIYLIPNHAGYASGTGGTIQVSVNMDDGTTSHNPSSTVLASYVIKGTQSLTPSVNFPVLTFPVSPALVAGQIYHIVFTNVDAAPTANYLSVDALYQQNPPTPTQPARDDLGWAELVRQGSGQWAQHKGYTPVLQLSYADGWTEGIG